MMRVECQRKKSDDLDSRRTSPVRLLWGFRGELFPMVGPFKPERFASCIVGHIG